MEPETDCVVLQECRKFYFKLSHDGQAGKMHGEALKARIVSFGESHFKSV